MKIKRVMCAIAALSMISALTGCGNSSTEAAPAPASQAESSAAPQESSAAAAEESSGTDYSVVFTPKNGVVYDTADCVPANLEPGNVVKGEITESQGPVARFQEGSYVMYNKLTFYAVMIGEKYVLYGAPLASGAHGSLSLLSDQVAKFWEQYREDMTEEELAKIRPWTTAQINGRVEVMPQELKDVFKAWAGDVFETSCETTHYLVDEEYHE